MAFISKKCGVFKRYWFTKERIDIRYALADVARNKRFVEWLQWRSEEIFFTQENLADCVVDRTHTIKTWTGLMKWNTYQGHEFEKPFGTVLFIRRRPEVCCYVPLLQQKTSLPSLVSLSRALFFTRPLLPSASYAGWSCFWFFTDSKQHKACELDMITLGNHVPRSYMTWLPVTLSVLDMSIV